jgi:hypothetical protein
MKRCEALPPALTRPAGRGETADPPRLGEWEGAHSCA